MQQAFALQLHTPAPKAAKLTVYETREILGMVFAWRGSLGRGGAVGPAK